MTKSSRHWPIHLLAFLTACQSSPAGPFPSTGAPTPETRPYAEIIVFHIRLNEWSARVGQDGRGMAGTGDAWTVGVPEGTLDFQSIARRLGSRAASMPADPHPTAETSFIHLAWQDGTERSYFVKDALPAAEVFELFRQAAKNGKMRVDYAAELEKEWRAHPPTPVSKAWDDPITATTATAPATTRASATRPQ